MLLKPAQRGSPSRHTREADFVPAESGAKSAWRRRQCAVPKTVATHSLVCYNPECVGARRAGVPATAFNTATILAQGVPQTAAGRFIKGNSRVTRMRPSEKAAARRQFGAAVLQCILAGLLLGAAFAGGYFYHDYADRQMNATTDYGLLQEAEGLLAGHYLYELPPGEELVHSAAAGMVAALEDPYTYFVEPQTAEIDSNNLAGSFGGIGAEITVDEQARYVIVRVYPDNPAEGAGVEERDIIAAVDGREVDATTTDMNALLSLVRGDIGDPVVLTLQRGDEV